MHACFNELWKNFEIFLTPQNRKYKLYIHVNKKNNSKVNENYFTTKIKKYNIEHGQW